MRYREVPIETQRQAPNNAHTPGDVYLKRAGFLTREGEINALGRHSVSRLQQFLASAVSPAEAFQKLGLPFIKTVDNACLFLHAGGKAALLHCPGCGYTQFAGLTVFQKQAAAPENMLPIQEIATPDCTTIEALANFLGIKTGKTAKAILLTRTADNKFILVVIRGDMQLSPEKLHKLVGETRPATEAEIIAAGTIPGYASPIGLHNAITIVDDAISTSPNLVAGANRAGYHIQNVNLGRDFKADTQTDLAQAQAGDVCACGEDALQSLAANVLSDEDGYNVLAIFQALAETFHDQYGLILPSPAAPFDVYLVVIPGKEVDTVASAEFWYDALQKSGLRVLYDDRNERAGVKFNDADLIGCPVRVTIGEKALMNGQVELKSRAAPERLTIPITSLMNTIKKLLTQQAAP